MIAIENARLFNETQEALKRETATSEILGVIAGSPTDARPVFDAIVLAAVRSLRCEFAFVLLREGEAYYAASGATPDGLMKTPTERLPLDPVANFPSRAILSGEKLHLPDWSKIDLPEHERNIQAAFGFNDMLYLPLMRESGCIGVFGIAASRPNAIGAKDIAQAESFRDQAVIAMENARLFNETQEALQRETATSEILEVIAGSPTDAVPVFQAIVAAAVRALRCDFAHVLICDRDGWSMSTGATTSGLMTEFPADRAPLDPAANFPSQAMLGGETLYLPDWSQIELPEFERNIQATYNVQSAIYLPLMRGSQCIGLIAAGSNRKHPFGPKDIAQAKSFRDQAVIAIENARLFDEVQAKTRDLEESLAQQTATADVLKVISRSAFDLDAIFQTLVATAVDLCKAAVGHALRPRRRRLSLSGHGGARFEPGFAALSRGPSASSSRTGIRSPDERSSRGRSSMSRTLLRTRPMRCLSGARQPGARSARRALARKGSASRAPWR